MSWTEYDSAGTHRFSFSLDGIESKTIKSVEGLSLKLDKVETKSVGHKGHPIHKAWAGNKQYLGTLTVTRVMTHDRQWEEWFKLAQRDVAAARKHGIVTVFMPDEKFAPSAREYMFKNAWPTELKITGMNASAANPVEETVTFVYEELYIE
jgi:phage tail-like protein